MKIRQTKSNLLRNNSSVVLLYLHEHLQNNAIQLNLIINVRNKLGQKCTTAGVWKQTQTRC